MAREKQTSISESFAVADIIQIQRECVAMATFVTDRGKVIHVCLVCSLSHLG